MLPDTMGTFARAILFGVALAPGACTDAVPTVRRCQSTVECPTTQACVEGSCLVARPCTGFVCMTERPDAGDLRCFDGGAPATASRCLRGPSGTCGWEWLGCPSEIEHSGDCTRDGGCTDGDAAACSAESCGPVPDGAAAGACRAGETGGFTGRCVPDTLGECRWEVLECRAGDGGHDVVSPPDASTTTPDAASMPDAAPPECRTAADCLAYDDACNACTCRPLARSAPAPSCALDWRTTCDAAPCLTRVAACVAGRCTLEGVPSTSGQGLDADGVAMLFAPTGGTSLRLGNNDPNTAPRFGFDYGTAASVRTVGGLRFWRLNSTPVSYNDGSSGRTVRMHLYASGGSQQYTFRNNPGYLSSAADVRNQEFTAYVRAVDITDYAHANASLIVRGGEHSANAPDRASCEQMTYRAGRSPTLTSFGKELVHPNYDIITLTPRFSAGLIDRRWVGLKLVSYAVRGDATRVVNRLYVDTEPFDANARPANHWRVLSEYIDRAGVDTGNYARLVDWGGWQTTLRLDGAQSLDVAIVSVREITPP